jgi:hypothetical protein
MKCFVNATVHTVDPHLPRAEALVVQDNRIVFVGTSAHARRFAGDTAEIIDLGGKLMVPGFIDDHVHFVLGGEQVEGLDTRTCTSKDEFIRTLRTYAKSHGGGWIKGGDWDHERWKEHTLPRKEWIDPFSADTPMFLPRLDWHMAVVNSAALRLAGITRDTPDPVGGTIERDPATGEPTGMLKDAAMDIVLQVIPPRTPEKIEAFVRNALHVARQNGVTSIHDVSEEAHIPIFRRLDREDALTCRIYSRLPLAGYRALVEQNVHHAYGTPFARIGSMKAFADGSLGSNTAWFFEPYVNEPTTGLAMEDLTSGRLLEWAMEADLHGLQLSVHAIGDRANDAVLNMFETIVRSNPSWDRRFRIEHAQHVRPDDIPRLAALGVIVSAQPYHAIDDGVWAERRIGPVRERTAYAFRSLLDAGVRLCFGSDWTVAPLQPLLGIYAAVTRRTLDGKNPKGWIPEQKVTVEEALRCYTIHNAYAEFEERNKGSLTPGKLADLVVLSDNIFDIPPETIGDVRVEMTMVDGKVVFQS